MTAEDRDDGWWDAPAGETWKCPECGDATPVEQWRERESPCDDCGSHDGRECPECGEVFDHVWGAARIDNATTEMRETPPAEA